MQGWQARLPSIRRKPAPDSDKPSDVMEAGNPAAAPDVMTEPFTALDLSASKDQPTTGLVSFAGELLLSLNGAASCGAGYRYEGTGI